MFSLIQEDLIYKEEILYSDGYHLRGVYYSPKETTTYKPIYGTIEPHDEESALILPSGVASSDARLLYSSEQLLGFSDSGDLTLADKVFLSDPEIGKTKPQRYVVMERELWPENKGFRLISTDDSNAYLLIKEEKVVNNGVS